MIFNSETRKRHQHIDRTIENTRNFLRKNQAALVNRLGLTAFQEHEYMTRRYFVPNIRHGEVRIPNRQSSNGIPVVALRPGERPHLADDFFVPSAVQRANMRTQLDRLDVSPGDIEVVIENITNASVDSAHNNPRRFPGVFAGVTARSPNDAMKATVYTPGNRQTIDLLPFSMRQVTAERVVLGRSLLGLLYRGSHTPPLTEAALLHEQTHLGLAEAEPIRPVLSREEQAREFFAEELRACHEGAQAVSINLQTAATPSQLAPADRYQHEVDRVRIGFNTSVGLSPEIFDPSIALMRALPTLAHDATQPWN